MATIKQGESGAGFSGKPRAVFFSAPRLTQLRAARVRRPMHPGRFLLTRFVEPTGLSQDALARQLGMSRRRLNELVRERRGITPDTAWRLARCFGVDAAFWLHLQAAWDAHRVAQDAQRGA